MLALVAPALGATAFLALASLMPLRLDQRNFQDQRRALGLDLPRGVPYLYVSLETDTTAYRFNGYALHNFAFPSSRVLWIIVTDTLTPRVPAWYLDEGGQVVSSSGQTRNASETLAGFVSQGVVLYDQPEARARAQQRAPILRQARVDAVLRPFPTSPLPPRHIGNEFSWRRWLRSMGLLAIPCCLAGLLWPSLRGSGWAGLGTVCLAVLLWGPVHVWFLSWAQVLPWSSPGPWPFVAWSAVATALWHRLSGDGGQSFVSYGLVLCQERRRWLFASLFVVLFFCGLYILRLDFDEDAHSHWLLMARSYFVEGRHVPELLTQHVAAVYPFGFAALMATTAWAADTPAEEFFGINTATAVAMLAYRIAVALLHLSFLVLMAWSLRSRHPAWRAWAALAAALAMSLFAPLQGRHLAAETVLFPLLGCAIMLLTSTWARKSPLLPAVGLFVVGSGTLVKLEGAFLGTLVVGPWLLAVALERPPWLRWRGLWVVGTGLGVAALPTLLWRLTLALPNEAFVDPSVSALLAEWRKLLQLEATAGLLLLRGGWVPLLALALPLAWAVRMVRNGTWRERLRDSLVPAAVAAATVGLPGIYVFTRAPAFVHLSVSYERLMVGVLFSAFWYSVLALGASCAEAGEEEPA